MQRAGDIEQALAAYAARGGQPTKIPEGKTTVDWSNGKLHRLARAMSKRGHQKRPGGKPRKGGG